jgi:predicted acylesterase/phospholipase RssA
VSTKQPRPGPRPTQRGRRRTGGCGGALRCALTRTRVAGPSRVLDRRFLPVFDSNEMVNEESGSDARIGLALSGGGHRATLFSLGVLLYLAETGLNSAVTVISSVSGGSITNGYVAQECNFNSASPEQFRGVASRLAKVVALRGVLFASWVTLLYLVLMTVIWGLTIAAIVLLSGVARTAVVAALFLVLGVAFNYRGAIASYAFGHVLFSHGITRTRLQDINPGPDHVFCATDLLAGEPFYFSRQFLYSYRLGWASPNNCRLQTAVQASAALPGAFPPARLRTSQFTFVRSRPVVGAAPMPAVFLVDGGVYNNLGTDWIEGLRQRAGGQLPTDSELKMANHLVVVNSSGQRAVRKSAGSMRLPYLRDLQMISLVTDVLYANTIAPRLHALHDASVRASTTDQASLLKPAVIQIDRSPIQFARGIARMGGPMGERANSVISLLESTTGSDDDEYWRLSAATVAQVKTTLSKVGREPAARIIHHGFVSAMTVLHITFGWPLIDPVPGDEIALDLLQS